MKSLVPVSTIALITLCLGTLRATPPQLLWEKTFATGLKPYVELGMDGSAYIQLNRSSDNGVEDQIWYDSKGTLIRSFGSSWIGLSIISSSAAIISPGENSIYLSNDRGTVTEYPLPGGVMGLEEFVVPYFAIVNGSKVSIYAVPGVRPTARILADGTVQLAPTGSTPANVIVESSQNLATWSEEARFDLPLETSGRFVRLRFE